MGGIPPRRGDGVTPAGDTGRPGPLRGLRVVELGGIGPGPHAAMLLADLGADVARIERPAGGLQVVAPENDWMRRNRRSIAADLKTPDGLALARQLIDRADVLIEGFRPGVTERLGIGPDECLERNPRLVYGRMTGWGQDGPLAQQAGHDINYLSLHGRPARHRPRRGPPGPSPQPRRGLRGRLGVPGQGDPRRPVGKGGLGRGQVVDAAIVDGVVSLCQGLWSSLASGGWADRRESNLLDGGSPFYGTYACSDGRYVAVGAIEPQFYVLLLAGLGLADAELPGQWDRASWPGMRERFAEIFARRPRDEWAEVFAGTDACVTPVLSLGEAPQHPHLAGRSTLTPFGGVTQAAPAPRFSRTATAEPSPPSVPGTDTAQVLADWGIEGSDDTAR